MSEHITLVEMIGDIWNSYAADEHTYVIVTTNLKTNQYGHAIMGAGIAKECRLKFPEIPSLLGEQIKAGHKGIVKFDQFNVIAFPTKYDWKYRSSPDLITNSVIELKLMMDDNPEIKVVMPRPGCGNGGLKWSAVKPILDGILMPHRNRILIYSME